MGPIHAFATTLPMAGLWRRDPPTALSTLLQQRTFDQHQLSVRLYLSNSRVLQLTVGGLQHRS